MGEFLDAVTDQLNLRWAWEKVRNQAQPGDIWFDQIELAGFELELEQNLKGIAQEVNKGTYRLTPLKPIPFPKPRDKEGKLRIRQTFQVAVRDQVAWTAVVNVVGPYVDIRMPVWSYGNRLYRTIWIEDDKGIKHRKIGRYRHASGQLYLPFRQSWPVFRRHVYLTTRAMANSHEHLPEPDERDKEELELQERLPAEHRCPFIDPKYWEDKRPSQEIQKLYWCCIDIEKFYPSLKLEIVRKNIVEQLPDGWKQEANKLIESMMQFKLDLRAWNNKEELREIGLNASRKTFSHIPTGLYVAGFLANAGLLKVDQTVGTRLREHNIAHLKFVDDHIILGYSLDDILHWVSIYITILNEERTGTRINLEKVTPEALAELLAKRKNTVSKRKLSLLLDNAEKACELDPQFPSPLMTKTITLVSGIARTDFNLLDANELATLTDQLEHLLLVDLPRRDATKDSAVVCCYTSFPNS